MRTDELALLAWQRRMQRLKRAVDELLDYAARHRRVPGFEQHSELISFLQGAVDLNAIINGEPSVH